MLGSVHAVTETGSLVAASMSGSQLGPYATGAGRVILVVGTQKIVSDLEEGLRRIDEYAFPLEDARAQAAYGVHSGVNKVLIINREIHARPHHRRLRRRGPRVLAQRKEQHTMATQIDTAEREIVLVEDAHIRPMMGLDILEPLPSRRIPYAAGGPVHPRPRGRRADHSGVGEPGYQAPAPWVRQPLVPARGRGQHRPQHRSRRHDGAGAAAGRIAPEAPNGPRRAGTRKGSARTSSGRARPAARCAASSSG